MRAKYTENASHIPPEDKTIHAKHELNVNIFQGAKLRYFRYMIMISQFVRSNPVSGSVLAVQSLYRDYHFGNISRT